MKCRNCGAELASGVAFCRECGTKVVQEKRFCRECGSELAEGVFKAFLLHSYIK